MSTLKKIAQMLVVGFVAICCCSCNDIDTNVNDEFKENLSSTITYETGTMPNFVLGTNTIRVEECVSTTTKIYSENSKITEKKVTQTTQTVQTIQNTQTVQTTQTTQTTQTAQTMQTTQITQPTANTERTLATTTISTEPVANETGSPIFWQDGFQYYKVQPDDSWNSIAEYLKVNAIQLAAANERSLADMVYIGENLFIPNEFIDYTQQTTNNTQPQKQETCNSGQYIGSSIVYSAPDNASWTNINQAVNDINGLTLTPGEYFSWNGYVGWKTAQYVNPETGINDWGYVEAPVIDGFEVGGGICVVSTALNKTARECGINTIKCSHSRPVSYASGDDEAAVDYGNMDLQFSNPFDYPIVFYASCSYGSVTISCYVA